MPRPLHVKRFGQGLITPQEYHIRHAFPPGARCTACAARPSVRAIVMIPYDDAVRQGMVPPGHMAGEEVLSRVCQLKGSDGRGVSYLRLSIAYSCPRCQSAFEKSLAKLPSYAVVDIHRGPDPHNRIVGAPIGS